MHGLVLHSETCWYDVWNVSSFWSEQLIKQIPSTVVVQKQSGGQLNT